MPGSSIVHKCESTFSPFCGPPPHEMQASFPWDSVGDQSDGDPPLQYPYPSSVRSLCRLEASLLMLPCCEQVPQSLTITSGPSTVVLGQRRDVTDEVKLLL